MTIKPLFTKLLLLLLLLITLTLLSAWLLLRSSLPQLDGQLSAAVSAPVSIQRDARGSVTIAAANRNDAAYASGFVHAQDRYFQMDLARRFAAGELAALFGARALEFDRQRRQHQMRKRAEQALTGLSGDYRKLLQDYVDGVNAGLAQLGSKPYEYQLLRQTPQPWRLADSALVLAGMYFQLQHSDARHELNLGALQQCYAAEVFDFLAPVGTPWDAPMLGAEWPQAALPDADQLNIRALPELSQTAELAPHTETLPGSNSWAVSGARSGQQAAWLANDMHLGFGVPHIWYRLHLQYQDDAGQTVNVGGVSLPGMPFVVVGSNGQIAWGFTNSYGDWLDLIALDELAEQPDFYRVPAGLQKFRLEQETIEVAGAEAETIAVQHSRWGPVIGKDHAGNPVAWRWIAHSEQWFLPPFMLPLEIASNVEQALALAPQTSIPAQNLLVADADGNIGWTIMGRMPQRVDSHRSRTPLDWRSAESDWPGWLPAHNYPQIVNPAEGYLFTANQRQADGEVLDKIGYGHPGLGARAAQIEQRLQNLPASLDASHMHAIQLDHEALFLQHWRDLLLPLLLQQQSEQYLKLAELLASDSSHAAADSAGYRLLREYRQRVIAAIMQSLTRACAVLPDNFTGTRQAEAPVWQILQQRPAHLLDAGYADWDDFLLNQADVLMEDAMTSSGSLADYRWGERNRLEMTHPLAAALGPLAGLLNMPATAMSGDENMPRVHTSDFGQSERMAIAPGDENEAYLSMPGGQSGHPLSPFYRSLHQDWLDGVPTPFLPGPVEHELELLPQ